MLGTFVEHVYSPNGEYCAFTISTGKQNCHKIMVIDVKTGKTHGKCLHLISCEKVAWSGDSEGFFIYVNIDMVVATTVHTVFLLCNSRLKGEIKFLKNFHTV